MKNLNNIMEEIFREYLEGINIPIRSNMKLSEMIELIKNNNSTNPHRAISLLT